MRSPTPRSSTLTQTGPNPANARSNAGSSAATTAGGSVTGMTACSHSGAAAHAHHHQPSIRPPLSPYPTRRARARSPHPGRRPDRGVTDMSMETEVSE